jgi:hypothetical protein
MMPNKMKSKQNNDFLVYNIVGTHLKLSFCSALKKRFMAAYAEFKIPFRTYMQTLVSQVLDTNFLNIIVAENGKPYLLI